MDSGSLNVCKIRNHVSIWPCLRIICWSYMQTSLSSQKSSFLWSGLSVSYRLLSISSLAMEKDLHKCDYCSVQWGLGGSQGLDCPWQERLWLESVLVDFSDKTKNYMKLLHLSIIISGFQESTPYIGHSKDTDNQMNACSSLAGLPSPAVILPGGFLSWDFPPIHFFWAAAA